MMVSQKNMSRSYTALAFLIIAAALVLVYFTVSQKSQTTDEAVHLASGYSYWATGDFRMNPEHPALVKDIAAIPLLFFHLDSKTDGPYFDQAHLWDFGPQVIYHNNKPGQEILMAGRTMMLLFFALLGVIVYFWAKKLYGAKTALVVLFFTMTCEVILGHAGLVTTDVPISFAFLFTCFTLTRFFQNPTKKTFAWFSLAFSLVLLVKYSALVVGVVIAVIAIAHSLLHNESFKGKFLKRFAADLLSRKVVPLICSLAIAIVVIIVCYGGGTKKIYESIDTDSARVVHEFVAARSPQEQKLLNWVGNNVPVVAFDYWEGMVSVLTHNEGGHTTAFLGEISNRGWWYYFPVVFLFKTSLADLAITVGAVAAGASYIALTFLRAKKSRFKAFWQRLQQTRFDFIVLAIAPAIFFAISMNSRLNLGLRYVLPIYPFIFLFAGTFLKYFVTKKYLRPVLVAVMGFSLYTTIHAFPNYLAFFNPFSWGNGVTPENITIDSNIDWGQDLTTLKKYMDQNHIDSIYLRYFGTADPAFYGIKTRYFPSLQEIKNGMDVSGYVAVSASWYAQPDDQYQWVHLQKPVAVLDNSIFIMNFEHVK